MRSGVSLSLFSVIVLALATAASADQGTVVKWSQPPGGVAGVPCDMTPGCGQNVASDVDWRALESEEPSEAPNWVVADDFISDGRPILTVRWWGSYFDLEHEPVSSPDSSTLVPVIEDGFLLSFFSDIPVDPTGGITFSRPGDLLASYIAPVMAVRITDTGLVGWDTHRIYEYEVNLQDTHLDHATSIADQIAFHEQAGVIYWLSVAAENGHVLDMSGEDWVFNDTGEPVLEEHYWGWHTSPVAFNDVAVMGDLTMPATGPDEMEWHYANWNPIEGLHGEHHMAFELLTIPEPSTALLFTGGLLAMALLARRSDAAGRGRHSGA